MSQFFLKKVQSKNFRNLNNQILEIDKNIVCIFGENAQGKTNILEMIYCLFHQKSFKKKTEFTQLLAIDGDKPEIYLSGMYSTNQDFYTTVKLTNESTDLYLNQEKIHRNKIKSSVYVLVPIDSYQFFMDRSERLFWLDKEIIRYRRGHAKVLTMYQKGLRQRNILLSSKRPDEIQIRALTKTLIKYGLQIQKERIYFIENMKDILKDVFFKLFATKDEISITYNSTTKNLSSEEEIFNFWSTRFEQEMQRGTTRLGCHLDDVEISLNGFPISAHASMGQQKIAFFSLFFASILSLKQSGELEHFPLVLLDDISSEIDSRRWKFLIKYLLSQQFQVFLTTANITFLEAIKSEEFVNIFLIKNGSISKI